MRAAVFHEAHQPMTIETLEVAKPQAHEVLLRTASSRRGELLLRASHRTVRAGPAYGSLDQSIRTPAPAGLIPAVCEGLATRL